MKKESRDYETRWMAILKSCCGDGQPYRAFLLCILSLLFLVEIGIIVVGVE